MVQLKLTTKSSSRRRAFLCRACCSRRLKTSHCSCPSLRGPPSPAVVSECPLLALMRSDDNGKDGRGMLPLHQLRQPNEASHRLSVSEVRPSDMIVVSERSLWCGECGRWRPVLALACSRRAFHNPSRSKDGRRRRQSDKGTVDG